jgi:hypothetical protein
MDENGLLRSVWNPIVPKDLTLVKMSCILISILHVMFICLVFNCKYTLENLLSSCAFILLSVYLKVKLF